jgi:ABC-type uncharacterized transport system auxiliary subunit
MNKITLIFLVTLLSACSSSSKKPADNLYYRFPASTIQTPQGLNIEVKRPSAMGILGNRPMVAQNSDTGLIQMSNNFWLDSPKVLLQNYLKQIFILNEKNESLILNSQILALEKKQNEAILSIKFTLTDSKNESIFDQTYKSKKSLSENSIAAFSKAIADLLEEMVRQLTKDIQ